MTVTALIIFFIGLIVKNQATYIEFLEPKCLPAQEKIVGGRVANMFGNQWMVLLQSKVPNAIQHCGGSLITNRFVLTAAHCQSPNTYATLGDYLITYDSGRERRIPVDLQIPHPYYNSALLKNDIALFRLAQPVEYTTFIRPICLPLNYDALNGVSRLTATGWGRTFYSEVSYVLKSATVNIYDRSWCSSLMRPVDESQICVRPGDGSPCFGDSGGPITTSFNYGGTDVPVQIGTVSYTTSKTCVTTSVHSRVYFYMNWISETVRQHDVPQDEDYTYY